MDVVCTNPKDTRPKHTGYSHSFVIMRRSLYEYAYAYTHIHVYAYTKTHKYIYTHIRVSYTSDIPSVIYSYTHVYMCTYTDA